MNSTCELGRHSARALKPYPAYKDSRYRVAGGGAGALGGAAAEDTLLTVGTPVPTWLPRRIQQQVFDFFGHGHHRGTAQLNGRGVFLPQESVDNYTCWQTATCSSPEGNDRPIFLVSSDEWMGPVAYAAYLVRFVPLRMHCRVHSFVHEDPCVSGFVRFTSGRRLFDDRERKR